jgi:hypothetical protein
LRVIWISVGLLAVVISLGFFFIEPDSDEPTVAIQSATISDPFVDNSGEKTVDLAVLPSGDPSTDNLNTSANIKNSDLENSDIENSETTRAATTASEEFPSNEVLAGGSRKSSVLDDNKNTQTVPSKIPSKTPGKKKLGLSMLAFEKEKKRNKIAIIVHENNSQALTAREIKALYMDKLTRWSDGSRVRLYNLPLGDKHREKFSEAILKMTALEADTAESKRRELRVNANPVEVKAKNIVVSYVEQHPNALAYVPLSLVREKSSVKVIFTIP